MVQSFLKPQKKLFKTILRALLGLGLGSYLIIAFLSSNYWITLLLVGILIPMTFLYNITRKGKNFEYCDTCPLSYADPPCNPVKNTRIRINKILNKLHNQVQSTNNSVDSNPFTIEKDNPFTFKKEDVKE